MIRTLTIITAFAAIAAPAAAEVKINIVGKDAATVRAEISQAAVTTCRRDLRGAIGSVSVLEMCRRGAMADALEQFERARASYRTASTPLTVTRISTVK